MPGCRTWQEVGPLARLNKDSPQANGLLLWYPMSEPVESSIRNAAERVPYSVTTGGGPTRAVTERGRCASFDGTDDTYRVSVDLSPYSRITLSQWHMTPSGHTSATIIQEYTSNGYSVAGGLAWADNDGTSSQMSFGIVNAGLWADTIVHPSKGVWHHYSIVYDYSTPKIVVYVDGSPVTQTTVVHDGTYPAAFTNSTLNIMSRNGASLYGPGKISDMRIYTREITAQEAWKIYASGYDLYWRKSRSVVVASAAAPASAVGHYYRNHLMARRRAS